MLLVNYAAVAVDPVAAVMMMNCYVASVAVVDLRAVDRAPQLVYAEEPAVMVDLALRVAAAVAYRAMAVAVVELASALYCCDWLVVAVAIVDFVRFVLLRHGPLVFVGNYGGAYRRPVPE